MDVDVGVGVDEGSSRVGVGAVGDGDPVGLGDVGDGWLGPGVVGAGDDGLALGFGDGIGADGTGTVGVGIPGIAESVGGSSDGDGIDAGRFRLLDAAPGVAALGSSTCGHEQPIAPQPLGRVRKLVSMNTLR